ncbi:beta-1,4-N-acetylgalactosaminyltransferase 3 isoform X1 [Oncorhynchus tshawytscha]|uniref:Beta-1,4-N-acetylgalactosaminyltransferase n=2 Tax=Oncorhynchus tshawytscha TaxID=74940 RepID=A0AAZ3S478_ONCTS|nr:beta-1,4-N-acetylgalactosaminyltransferase 3 isoform X1 [Oncorhynchus tshawytscha]
MVKSFFPLKKLRRSGKHMLFLVLLMLGAFAVYHEFVATKAWRSTKSRFSLASEDSLGRIPTQERLFGGDASEDSEAWRSSYTPQPWRPEYKGRANLHTFEDWCGSSTAQLRMNLHYPLYPHSRTTVKKLAVSPRWMNYGLRIFGYLHPYTDGEFVFAVSSDDNSEFWLSRDNSPLNLQLLAWIGKTGMEWTAPGEFGKYASQTSRPVWLSVQRRYFFEIVHKQNDRGTDHIEVAWQLNQEGLRFTVISSKYISLYSNESALRMSDITHVPQTAASHTRSPSNQPDNQLSNQPAADMLRVDPRDTLYQIPALDSRFLQGVLPDCSYKPSYIIKGFPLLRYQGLQFVHMSYIYPNDYTRLTHMETDNTCFYHDSPLYLDRYGFSRYMRLDEPEGQEGEGRARGRVDGILRRRKAVPEERLDGEAPPNVGGASKKDPAPPDYGDDNDDYAQRRRRKLFSLPQADRAPTHTNMSDTLTYKKRRETNAAAVVEQRAVVQTRATEQDGLGIPPGPGSHTSLQTIPAEQLRVAERPADRPAEQLRPVKSRAGEQKPGGMPADNEDMGPVARKQTRPRGRPAEQNSAGLKILPAPQKLDQNLPVEGDGPEVRLPQLQGRHRRVQQPGPRGWGNATPNPLKHLPPPTVSNWSFRVGRRRGLVNRTLELWSAVTKQSTTRLPEVKPPLIKSDHKATVTRKRVQVLETDIILRAQPQIKSRPQPDYDNTLHGDLPPGVVSGMDRLVEGVDRGGGGERGGEEVGVSESLWGLEGDSEEVEGLSYDSTPRPVFDPEVNWAQTFQVTPLDLQAMRSDWIDLRCNVSGNLLLRPRDALPVIKAFMDKLNHRHHGRFSLVRVLNVERRVDGAQGSRYFLELELRDVNGQHLRLSHYIYTLIRHRRSRPRGVPPLRPAPEMLLCNPVGFHWNPTATVHFIVPVKNQARWVQQLIVDMEGLYQTTGDPNFNLIITDYNSTDMDIEAALKASTLHRYQYLKLSGNFERSAGLQAGIDLITNEHSIVFLCDLHIHFPPSIIDSVRKHCVEGHMAFAPIVMRLDCGATPREPRGYWEVNGFGLLGIYKSDLDAAGGMNTHDFTDRWGGEDWELLDRILQSGLEVERIYMRNFLHHYHSKRGMWNRRTQRSGT